MDEAARPVKRDVRRAFDRAARTYDGAAILQREICGRLLEHLDPIRLEPRRVLDLGCGTGSAFEALSKRYPRAAFFGLDLAPAMLAMAKARSPWWRRALGGSPAALACADAERLPIAGRSMQLVFSNLALQWCDPEAVFAEVSRVLEPGGLFLFSTFGPDTLRELRAAFA
jgi:malonyl-CoA O-methyltransferase